MALDEPMADQVSRLLARKCLEFTDGRRTSSAAIPRLLPRSSERATQETAAEFEVSLLENEQGSLAWYHARLADL